MIVGHLNIGMHTCMHTHIHTQHTHTLTLLTNTNTHTQYLRGVLLHRQQSQENIPWRNTKNNPSDTHVSHKTDMVIMIYSYLTR